MFMTYDGIAEIPSYEAHGIQQSEKEVSKRPTQDRNPDILWRRRALNTHYAFDHVRG